MNAPFRSPLPGHTISHAGFVARTGPGASLRELRHHGLLLLDGIELTIRDDHWGTIDHEATPVEPAAGELVRWRIGGGNASGHVVVRGLDGGLAVEVDLVAERHLVTCRVGLVVLHPLDQVGQPVRWWQGPSSDLVTWPARVSPWPVFSEIDAVDVGQGDSTVRLAFGGERFETEDHRNWCDAGWKSYAPPLARSQQAPWPAGTARRAEVTVQRVDEVLQRHEQADINPGTGVPATWWVVGPGTADALASIGAGDLFVEVLDTAAGRQRFEQAADLAEASGRRLWCTLALDAPSQAWRDLLSSRASVLAGVCVVDRPTHGTTPVLLQWARDTAQQRWLTGSGTRGYLAELGRSSMPHREADYVQLSVAAQVHHTDPERVLDTLRALPHVVATARSIAGGRPVVLAPVSVPQRLSVHVEPDDHYASWCEPVAPHPDPALQRAWLTDVVGASTGAWAVALDPTSLDAAPRGDRMEQP
ncbi:hypothetical protein [Aestuariimicrobium ganziense]|uniref:hypothetical protein n=1 Tax=Aestuariimicrobium ganziense TaxID=2773677 RepID=UPI001943F04D|nr:hypothetical protein [Aestuariimicrobium ganziense]